MSQPDSGIGGLSPSRWPGLWLLLPGASLAFVLMANDRQLPFGVPLGALGCLLAAVGILSLFGSFAPKTTLHVIEPHGDLAPSLLRLAFVLALFLVAVRSAVSGTLIGGAVTAAVAIPTLLAGGVILLYRVVNALGIFGDGVGLKSAIWKRPSLYLLLVTIFIYAPLLGSYSLIDPWETHYGEVAREILARDDWMSLWWAQDGFFWSKPVLDFWLQALSFALLSVRHAPDGMLSAFASGQTPYPEWAARLPILLCSLIGQVLLYAGVAKAWNRRAALLGSLLLVAVPHYTLIVHQSMTDLPYIAALMAAMGLFLLGYHSADDDQVRGYRVELGRARLVLSAHQLLYGTVILFSLPQILYLFSRNLGLVTAGKSVGFYLHLDRFYVGSGGGNCGLPGNEPCRLVDAANSMPQPSLSALIWSVLLLVLLWFGRNEFRKKRLYYLGAWLFIALSAMAKGLPGPILFIGTIFAFLLLDRRLQEVVKLSLPNALLILAVVALPWFVQSTVRNGPDFLDRLFVHDMYKRAFEHVHDTNAGDDVSIRYYLWQLGYGLFPATGIITVGVLSVLGGQPRQRREQAGTGSFLLVWFLVGFGMFSLTLTKYHHYIIPVIPPLCMMSGPMLSNALSLEFGFLPNWMKVRAIQPKRYDFGLLGVIATLVVFFAGLDLFGNNRPPGGAARLINLVTYNYARPWPEGIDLSATFLGFTVATSVVLLGWFGPRKIRGLATLTLLGLTLAFSAWVSNRYLMITAPHWGQRNTIAAYYRLRKSPEEPLVAYQMNWKGENFYTGNHLATFIATGDKFKQWVKAERDAGKQVLFVTLEHSRIGGLKSELGPVRQFEVVTNKALNNKFALVRVSL